MGSGQPREGDGLTEGAWGVLDKFEEERTFDYILAFQKTEIRRKEDEKMTLQVDRKRRGYRGSKMQHSWKKHG